MKRYVEGRDRFQTTLLPASLDDYVGEDNPVGAVDAFIDELDLARLGFARAEPADTVTQAPRLGDYPHMPITLQFAFHVRDLHRMGHTAERIAEKLGVSLEDVMEGWR